MKYINISRKAWIQGLLPVRRPLGAGILLLLLLGITSPHAQAQGQQLSLFNASYNTPKVFAATQTLSVGPDVVIENGGEVTLGAPSVFLLKDVHVKNGGKLFIVSGLISTRNEALLNPFGLEVSQNYPNPFSASTQISYQLGVPGQVDLVIYDTYGREIKKLFSGFLAGGSYTVEWDGTNQRGSAVASGLYFYKVVAGPAVITKGMMLTR